MSSPSDPVDTTCTSCAAWESIFMMEPLPNCFSICARAACRALALPSSMTFPSLTMGLSLILTLQRTPAPHPRPPSIGATETRNCLLVAPSRQRSRGASPLERADETAVDLDFYTVPEKMQAPKTNQGLRQASAEGFAGGPGIRGPGRQLMP